MADIPFRLKKAVRKQQILFVCRTIKSQLIANYSVGIALVWLLKDFYPLSTLLSWFFCMVVIYFTRFIVLEIYRRYGEGFCLLGMGWELWFAFVNLLGGSIWGFACYEFYSVEHVAESMFILALMVGFVAGSLAAHFAYFPAFAVYSTVVLGMMVMRMLLEGGTIESLVAILGVFYYLVMMTSGRASQDMVKQAIVARLQVEELNQELVEQQQALVSARDVAEKANMAKSRFLATASHDLRQPLHALRLFVDILSERAKDASVKQVADKIANTAEALEGLFSNLLELAKVDARVAKPHFTAVPLMPLIQHICMESEPLAQDKGLTFRVHCRDVAVHSDVTMLTRIVRNFVTNAIRYTDQGGILVGCRLRGDNVHIEVRDTGVGIPEEHLTKVFEEFHQVSNHGRDRSKGLGLGLAIAERLANLLGTTVKVWSQEGRGSCFSVTVPRVAEDSSSAQASSVMPLVPPSIAGLRVVFVDDEQEIRDAMQELLESWKCEYILAENLSGILAQVGRWDGAPGIIVTDYRLRDGQVGTQVIAGLREHFEQAIPAIIITGDTSRERLEDAATSGASILHKPIKAIKLRMLMEQLVSQGHVALPCRLEKDISCQ